MSYFLEITNELYSNLVEYYQEHKDEFFSLRSTRHIDRSIHECFYKIINNKENFVSMCYSELVKGLFDVDFIGDSLEKTAYINVEHNSNHFEHAPLWEKFYDKENKTLSLEVRRIIYADCIMNNFIKKVRLYYLEDFMHNKELSRELLVFKAEINNIYPRINHVVSIGKYQKESELIKDVYQNKLVLLDYISDIIDGEFFKDLVLKQQEFYVKELTRLQEAIEKEGNKFKCNDSIFAIYVDFINKFKQKAEQKIVTLTFDAKQMKKSI